MKTLTFVMSTGLMLGCFEKEEGLATSGHTYGEGDDFVFVDDDALGWLLLLRRCLYGCRGRRI